MKGFVQDIEAIAVKNEDFRQVLYTARNCQLVVMALKPKEEIGAEVHKRDQFFRVEEGTGRLSIAFPQIISAGFAVLVPWTIQYHQRRQCPTEPLIRSMRRRIIGTALSTIPVLTRRWTTNT